MSERWNEMDDVDLVQLEAEMSGELHDLREAATVYADRAWGRGVSAAPARRAARRGWMALAAGGVAAAVLGVAGVQMVHRSGTPEVRNMVVGAPAVEVHAPSPVSDEALLEQIQSDISSGVPAAMQPLQASTDANATRDVVKR